MSPTSKTSSWRVPSAETELVDALRSDLRHASFESDSVDSLLSTSAYEALKRGQRVPALCELADSDAAGAILTRLFMLGDNVPAKDVQSVLPQTGVSGLVALGLVTFNSDEPSERRKTGGISDSPSSDEEGSTVRALFDLRPHAAELPGGTHHWWILSDLGEEITGKPVHSDHVLGVGGATKSLLTLTIRDHVDSALDLGTGCGIQALYLATHANRIVATDLSKRACQITRFNAQLNEVDLDVRQGSLFEPVDGETFDLIVSNPPFVITPDSLRQREMMEYRDGGMVRDSLVALITKQAPAYLRPGGTLHMLANWEIPDSDDDLQWFKHPQQWIEAARNSHDHHLGSADVDPDSDGDGRWQCHQRNTGCLDALVVQREVLDPEQYVEMWLRDSGGLVRDRAEYEADYALWLKDFHNARVCAIGLGYVLLRRRVSEYEGHPSTVFDDHREGNIDDGKGISLALSVMAILDEIGSEGMWDLLATRNPHVTEERQYTPGEVHPKSIIIQHNSSTKRRVVADSALAALCGTADGELTLRQILLAYCSLTGENADEVYERLTPAVGYMLRVGILDVPRELEDTRGR